MLFVPPLLPAPPTPSARAKDVQLAFTMLDPYVRQPLLPSPDGKFSLRFRVPDVYGVFTYVIDYHHAGYSYVNLQRARRRGVGVGEGVPCD
jgi:hypothetical protein